MKLHVCVVCINLGKLAKRSNSECCNEVVTWIFSQFVG